jgi:hypothetical protein
MTTLDEPPAMTAAAGPAEAPQASPARQGRQYLTAAAAPAGPGTQRTPEAYASSLALLPGTRTREERAAVLDAMADQAGHIARLVFGTGTEDSDSDPLAWHETATLLRRLAAAQRGLVLTVEHFDDQDWSQPWEDLANAATAAEHAAAFAAVKAQLTGACDDEPSPVRTAAIRRLCEAADGCTAAYPGVTR